jgi:hypothetical protein
VNDIADCDDDDDGKVDATAATTTRQLDNDGM